MRVFLLTAFCTVSTVALAETPNKRSGGLFGFGGSQKKEQISSALFPGGEQAPAPTYSRAASSAEPSNKRIFREGQPARVEPTSYVIENGKKIEKPLTTNISQPETATDPAVLEATGTDQKKKRGLFGFGKSGEDSEANPVVHPVPAAAPVAAPVPQAVEAPAFAGTKEKSGWAPSIPFLHRNRKSTEPEVLPAEIVEKPVAEPVIAAASEAKPKPKPAAKPAAKPASPAPAGGVSQDGDSFVITRDPSKPPTPEKKEKSKEGGLLSPIAKLPVPVPRKEIDLTGAETIIQNGEIVAESGTSLAPSTSSVHSGPRQPPQVINGVKTYSSWDDVSGRSSSAADRIINQ
ncbi:MAG TPA: hypothetical protein PLA50_17005, partial [Bacteroidia bacterium]|nr:hypothetical protein [Bacteroidia bacterium]